MMIGVNQRRVKRGKVGSPFVEAALKSSQSGVSAEPSQKHNNGDNLNPPRIAPLGFTEAPPSGGGIYEFGHVHPLATA